MSTASGNEVELLEFRLRQLETLLLVTQERAAVDQANSSERHLTSRLAALETQFRHHTKRNFSIDEFIQKYEAMKPFLDNHSLEMEAERLPAEAKLEILMSSETELTQVCQQLAELEPLQKYVNPPEFGKAAQCAPAVEELVTKHRSQAQEHQSASQQLLQIIDAYNTTVNSLSEMFLTWDGTLAEIEGQIRALEKKP
ncbi:hypothetical protein H4R33_000317 [Dimargaris cristalligena]|uniref:Dynactin subunit 3 n=1 Tax=Dimargaris cristalligena TaxID=215637 RepID=A0A4P9ZQD3_9FUNG|nr:hypothetical protein H4R33_000317 [Dimargaris cristalligena]RKP35686.1 hypothetical protein BJ085DRAFT_32859 [Dimargaris cristalligena]|eukprot:RKP35686.1 hypothetical protein BJ085DRAFT_32859 [Dimargaris cristalligena]